MTVVPGKQFAENELVTRTKLNQLGSPVVTLSDEDTDTLVAAVRQNVPTVNRNILINGNFDVWQRGGYVNLDSLPTTLGSASGTAVYGADRWYLGGASAASKREISRQSFSTGQTDVPYEPTYFLRWKQLVGETGAYRPTLAQPIEDVRTMAGKDVVVTWWMKGDYSGAVTCRLRQFFGGSPGTSRNVTATTGGAATLVASADWAKFTATFSIPDLSGQTVSSPDSSLLLEFLLPDNVTFQIDFAQVQMEEGAVATPFETLSLLEQARRCERYFEYHAGIAASDITTNHPCYYFATRKYKAPTITIIGSITGTGVAFSTLLDVGYQQSTANSAVTAFFVSAEAELFI